MEDNKRTIVRTYRIVVDDESVYSLQKKYFYPRNTEKMPTVEKDVFSMLSEPYLAITENIFIPTNKIKKIILVNESTEICYIRDVINQ